MLRGLGFEFGVCH